MMTRRSKESGSRRAFLRRLGLLAGVTVVGEKGATRAASLLQAQPRSDEHICRSKFDLAVRESLQDRPIGEVVVAIGTSFLETPYGARTLEGPGAERLVVNLRALDCVTFVENTLALSRCVKLRSLSYDAFGAQLQLIRYRGGKISGYQSRLHYFSEWILDNAAKGIVVDSSRSLGGIPYKSKTTFMSQHTDAYHQLASEDVLEAIRQTEETLNRANRFYIPKETLAGDAVGIRHGDIIGITTSIEGLDVSHTGIAVEMNGTIRYLHAPLSGGAVQISENSLSDYVLKNAGRTGIMVARPVEPG